MRSVTRLPSPASLGAKLVMIMTAVGIIAEGVETEAQVQALRLAGASHLQGYFFSRPVPAASALEMAMARFIGGEDDTAGDSIAGTGTQG